MSSRKKSLHGQTIALAGLYQAAFLVQQTARGQVRDPVATNAALGSIFITSPPEADAVYGDTGGLLVGLSKLCQQLDNNSRDRDMELTSYVISLIYLERKLSRQTALLTTIANGIEKISGENEQGYEVTPESVAALAGIYSSSISTLTPRIMVQGDPDILNASASRDMVRALLLAGIRAAVLWRQSGGNRFALLFRRKALLDHARQLASKL